jgi:nucleoside-diphosphate-sugar epimerase
MALYLVTGGAGFIGSHIVEALVSRSDTVRVLDNFSTGRRANLKQLRGIDLIEGDIRDAELVRSAIRGVDYVIHEAALVSVTQSMAEPELCHAVNVTGTLNVLEAARECGVRRVILASSCAVYGDNDELPLSETSTTKPMSPYAASKLIGEIYSQTFQRVYRTPTVCLRYFNIYGSRQDPNGEYAAVIPKFAQRLKSGQAPIIYGDGHQTRDFVHVSDVVRANLLACESEAAIGQVFNIATGRGISLLELVDTLNQLLGTSIQPMLDAPRAGDIRRSWGDAGRLAAAIDFRPAVSLAEGLAGMTAALSTQTETESVLLSRVISAQHGVTRGEVFKSSKESH